MLDQLGELLQSPTIIFQMVKMDKSITAPKFRSALKNIHEMLNVMCYYEQCKLLNNMIQRILVFDDRLEIEPNVESIKKLLYDAGVKGKNENSL